MYGNHTFRMFRSDLEAAQCIEREGHECMHNVEMISNEARQRLHLQYRESEQGFATRALFWYQESATARASDYVI